MIFRKKKEILVMIRFLFLQIIILTLPVETNAKDFLTEKDIAYLTDYLNCSEVAIFHRFKFDSDDPQYKWILWSYDCKSKEYVAVVKHFNGRYSEIERLCSDEFAGSKIDAKRLKSKGIDYLFVMHSFEPNGVSDMVYVRIFNLKHEKIMLSAWSYKTPKIGDLNGDGNIDVVIYKRAFSIDMPGEPNWPIIISLGDDIEIKDLYFYQDFLQEELDLVRIAIDFWKDICKGFNKTSCPDLISERINALKSLEKNFEKTLNGRH